MGEVEEEGRAVEFRVRVWPVWACGRLYGKLEHSRSGGVGVQRQRKGEEERGGSAAVISGGVQDSCFDFSF